MLRDYIWSLLAVAFILGTYTALMLTFTAKKSNESRLETAHASISIKAEAQESGAAGAAMKLSD